MAAPAQMRSPARSALVAMLLLAALLPVRAGAAAPYSFGTGPQWRYPSTPGFRGLVERGLLDVVGMPASAPRYSATDWTVIGLTLASTAALSFPFEGGSGDVRMQRAIREWLGPSHFKLWTHQRDLFIYAGIAAITLGLFSYGELGHHPEYVESSVLMFEAFAVTEFYHVLLKFLTGRQGTWDGEGKGLYKGPAGFLKYFPAGTPSGHMASIMSLVAVLTTFWSSPVLNAALGLVALVAAATLIADDYHYVSDVLVGAVMGYGMGRWIVDHRSSLYKDAPDGTFSRSRDPLQSAATTAPMTFAITLPF